MGRKGSIEPFIIKKSSIWRNVGIPYIYLIYLNQRFLEVLISLDLEFVFRVLLLYYIAV